MDTASLPSQTVFAAKSDCSVNCLAVAWRSLTSVLNDVTSQPLSNYGNDASDYCYRSCRSDSVKVLRAAHTAGSSAAHPYFCQNTHITEAQGRLSEDLCTWDDGPVKYRRPASVALYVTQEEGQQCSKKTTTPVLLFLRIGLCCYC